MTQKLLVMERDTKEELEKAINKHLKDAQFKVVGLSVLETNKIKEGIYKLGEIPERTECFEAWIIIDDNADLLAGFD